MTDTKSNDKKNTTTVTQAPKPKLKSVPKSNPKAKPKAKVSTRKPTTRTPQRNDSKMSRSVTVSGPKSAGAVQVAIRVAQLEERVTRAAMSGKAENRLAAEDADKQLQVALSTIDASLKLVSKTLRLIK